MRTQTAPAPTGVWGTPASLTVPNNHYWLQSVDDYGYRLNNGLHQFYRKVDVYRNQSGQAKDPLVYPEVFPIPLGVPLPMSLPAGYPLLEPMAEPLARPQPRPLPRPRNIPEVAIEIPLGRNPVPRVYPARPRKPGKKAKERKYYGKAGAWASFVFWLYEATDDWKDWLNIIVNAIDGVPAEIANGSPNKQAIWLRDNPWALTRADLGEVLTGLAGWLVDEAFGAYIGKKNMQANRSISTSQRSTVDMRTNVSLHYSPAGQSPGQMVTEFLRQFT